MLLEMKASLLKEAVDKCSSIIDPKSYKDVMKTIKVNVSQSGVVTFSSTDGYRIQRIQVPSMSNDGEFEFNMPVIKIDKVQKGTADYVKVEVNMNTIEFDFLHSKKIETNSMVSEKHLDLDKFFDIQKEKTASIAVNPKYLMEIAKNFKDEKVLVIDVYGTTDPVVMYNEEESNKALLLPIGRNK